MVVVVVVETAGFVVVVVLEVVVVVPGTVVVVVVVVGGAHGTVVTTGARVVVGGRVVGTGLVVVGAGGDVVVVGLAVVVVGLTVVVVVGLTVVVVVLVVVDDDDEVDSSGGDAAEAGAPSAPRTSATTTPHCLNVRTIEFFGFTGLRLEAVGQSTRSSPAVTGQPPVAFGSGGSVRRVKSTPAPSRDVILGVDIGGTKFAAGLMTMRGTLLDRNRVEVDPDVGPQSHFAALASIVAEMRENAASQHGARIRAIGVGCAGPIERNCETVSPLNIPSWRRFPLRDHLHDLTGLPVYGDLDAKALALAEGWLGAAQGVSSFCTMTVSTGVGGGLVIDGELLDGRSGNAGHIGHLIVEPGGRRCGCGARGCLEAEASGLAIEAITGRPPTEPTYDIMRRTGRLVGRAAGMVCTALDLDLVVVGGGVALGFAATFFNAAQEEIDAVARVGHGTPARITPARLGDQGPLIGAGAVGLRGLRRKGTPRRAAPPSPSEDEPRSDLGDLARDEDPLP